MAVHVHVGSQITTIEPLRRAAAAVAACLSAELRDAGVALEYVDLGGGLGISYDGATVPSAEDYVAALVDEIRASGLPIVIEPGRAIAGPVGGAAGARHRPQAAQRGQRLRRDRRRHDRADAAGALRRVPPHRAGDRCATPPRQYEIVGPVCESSDVVGRDRMLPALEVGDLVAIRDAGAYGSAMASNYNRRPLPAEVLVDEGRWRVISRRQTIDDMLALET